MTQPRRNLGSPTDNARRVPTRSSKRPRRRSVASPYARETSICYQNQKRGLFVVDGNSPEAHFLRRVHRRLIDEHLGGRATDAQLGLVNLIAWAELRLLRLNAKFIRGEETPYDVDMYFAHS